MEPVSNTEIPSLDFVTTWQQVMSDPRGFFANMPEAGGLAEPMRFLALCAAIDGLGTLLVKWSVISAIGAFLAVVAGAVLLAAILTVLTQQIFEGRSGFEGVFRAVAFAAAPAVFFWVPWVAAIPVLYSWYLQVCGIERVQGLDGPRAALATVLAWAAVWFVARGLAGRPLGWPGTF